jgi:hypothetical protein
VIQIIVLAIVQRPQSSIWSCQQPPNENRDKKQTDDRLPVSTFRESRRSTRVPLKVVIRVERSTDRLSCEGETVVVNLHGALLATAIARRVGLSISIRVFLTGKGAGARVVYIDPSNPLRAGIELISRKTFGA